MKAKKIAKRFIARSNELRQSVSSYDSGDRHAERIQVTADLLLEVADLLSPRKKVKKSKSIVRVTDKNGVTMGWKGKDDRSALVKEPNWKGKDDRASLVKEPD